MVRITDVETIWVRVPLSVPTGPAGAFNAARQTLYGNAPVTVAVAPDSHRAYVVDRASNVLAALSVIDTAANTVIATVGIGGDPGAVVVTPDGRHAYVTNQGSNAVSLIDTGI